MNGLTARRHRLHLDGGRLVTEGNYQIELSAANADVAGDDRRTTVLEKAGGYALA